MDNLTHSLIGIVAGDTVARSTSAATSGLGAETRRAFLVTIGVIGGNLPDSDLIVSYAGFTRDKLAYLLQHRGYTHTILGCVVLALLLYGGAERVAKLRRLTLSRADRVALLGMALFATLLHLGMDSLNSYGVHPFWPFNNEWFYGDSVFIIEPLYRIAAAPICQSVLLGRADGADRRRSVHRSAGDDRELAGRSSRQRVLRAVDSTHRHGADH